MNGGARSGGQLQLWARYGLCPRRGALDGALLTSRDGRIVSVEVCATPPSDFPADCIFDSHLLTPGLLNAHCHLDYSYLKGALPRGQGFAPWLRAMIAARRAGLPENAADAARAGVKESIEGGVCEVWDIDALKFGRDALKDCKTLRRIAFREIIAPNRKAWEEAAWKWENDPLPDDPDAFHWGASPHSLYSVCEPALALALEFARMHGAPLAIHLAESREEIDLLTRAEGPLAEIFAGLGLDPKLIANDCAPPIQRAERIGCFGPATLAIHCNCPEPGDAEILAYSGAVVVFCPGAHAFFGYPEYPLKEYRSAGVRMALGTDSLASADSLSMHEQARRLAALAPEMAPLEILSIASGAALGALEPFGGRGVLEPGKSWALWTIPTPPQSADANQLAAAWLDPETTFVRSSASNDL